MVLAAVELVVALEAVSGEQVVVEVRGLDAPW